jgi:hypothetical protein
MTDLEMSDLRARAERGDSDAADELIEFAAEDGDLATLERLAAKATRPPPTNWSSPRPSSATSLPSSDSPTRATGPPPRFSRS